MGSRGSVGTYMAQEGQRVVRATEGIGVWGFYRAGALRGAQVPMERPQHVEAARWMDGQRSTLYQCLWKKQADTLTPTHRTQRRVSLLHPQMLCSLWKRSAQRANNNSITEQIGKDAFQIESHWSDDWQGRWGAKGFKLPSLPCRVPFVESELPAGGLISHWT